MEKYKQISDDHTHEFNATQEMRQTQEWTKILVAP